MKTGCVRPSRLTLLLLAFGVEGCRSGEDSRADVSAFSFEAARLSEHVRVLAGDAFQGRGMGTAGEGLVVDYLTGQYAAAGFEPGGPGGTWTQSVAVNRFATSEVQAALAVGTWTLPLAQGEQVVVSSRVPGERVALTDVPLVFVGYGIKAPERDWDDFKGQDLRGLVLVVLVNDADCEEPSLDTFDGEAMTYYGRWTYKYEEAARQGAAGVLVIHESGPATYDWSVVANSWTGPQFDLVRDGAPVARVPLEGWIQRSVAVELFQRAGLDFEKLKILARGRGFSPVTIPGGRLSATFSLSTTRVETRNVIARLPGTSRPDEIVLYTAHWDHLGTGGPEGAEDRIFNGAVDNATGNAGLLELARAWGSGPPVARSIVMINFTGEESGLLGSEFYAANPVYPLAKTVAGFNLDCMNVFGRVSSLGISGFGLTDLDGRLTAAATRQGRFTAAVGAEWGGYFRSDQWPLARRGVPMAYFELSGSFVDSPTSARDAARDAWFSSRYHDPSDEWSASWDLSGQIEDLEVVWWVGRELAESRDWPAPRAPSL